MLNLMMSKGLSASCEQLIPTTAIKNRDVVAVAVMRRAGPSLNATGWECGPGKVIRVSAATAQRHRRSLSAYPGSAYLRGHCPPADKSAGCAPNRTYE